MIGTIDVAINAARPGMPLTEFAAFVDSPSQVRVRNVPRGVGRWQLTAVYVAIQYPDNAVHTVAATHTGALWTATLPASTQGGSVTGGLQILADGEDEAGNAITGYVLGSGDVRILPRNTVVVADGIRYALTYWEDAPEMPNPGDCAVVNGALSWYDGSAWQPLGTDPAITEAITTPAQMWFGVPTEYDPYLRGARVNLSALLRFQRGGVSYVEVEGDPPLTIVDDVTHGRAALQVDRGGFYFGSVTFSPPIGLPMLRVSHIVPRYLGGSEMQNIFQIDFLGGSFV